MPSNLHCHVQRDEAQFLVRVSGVLTMSSASRVRTALLKCLAEQPDTLVVDVSGLAVPELAALSVFAAVARQAEMWPGTPVLLCATDAATVALVRTGRAGNLPVFPSVPAALASDDGRIRLPSITDELLPVSGAARRARDLVTEACGRWDQPELVGPASIVVSELVTNVVVHARTMMTLRLSLRRRYLHIAVRDGSIEEPRLVDTSPLDATGGRGIALVDAVARRWGSLPTDGGKVVWAVLSTAPFDDRLDA